MLDKKYLTVIFIAAFSAFESIVLAGTGGPLPVGALQEKADAIVIATLQSATGDGTGNIKAELMPTAIIKGQLPITRLAVEFAPSPIMIQMREAPSASASGLTGMWFLKQGQNGSYNVLPTASGYYTWQYDALIPTPTGFLPPATGTISQKVLSVLVSSYASVPNPNSGDDGRLLASLANADRQDALAVANELIASTGSSGQHLIGLAAAIQLGSDEALLRLAREVEALRSQNKFFRVIEALQLYYKPQNASSITALRQLIELRSDAAGLDTAIEAALARFGTKPTVPAGGPSPAVAAGPGIGSKDVLPLMAELLDSPDPKAQLRAAQSFGFFTMLADPDGNIEAGQQSGRGYPFRTDNTRMYTPREGSTITPSEYVAFWKSWWAQNRAKLGFSAP